MEIQDLQQCTTSQHPLLIQGSSCSLNKLGHLALRLYGKHHGPDIIVGDEIDGNTLSTKSATSTNSVQIVLHVGLKRCTRRCSDTLLLFMLIHADPSPTANSSRVAGRS